MIYFKPGRSSLTTTETNAFRFLLGDRFASGKGERPVPDTQQLLFFKFPWPAIPKLYSRSLSLPRCPAPPPLTFTHPDQCLPDSVLISFLSDDRSGLVNKAFSTPAHLWAQLRGPSAFSSTLP